MTINETLEWVDPDGAVITFDGADNVVVLPSPSGRMMPPVRMLTEPIPGLPGERLRYVTHGARVVQIPLLVTGVSAQHCRDVVRGLARAFNPVRGDGKIVARMGVGTDREITCRYRGGLEGDETTSGPAQREIIVVPEFWADPYWQDTSDTVVTLDPVEGPTWLTDPWFPWQYASSEVSISDVISNDGDIDLWPIFTITGPGSDPVLTNTTTGEYIGLSVTLEDGDSVTIDTRPVLGRTIRDGLGNNLFSARTDGSSFWSAPRGTNVIQLEMTNTSNLTTLEARFRRQYLTA